MVRHSIDSVLTDRRVLRATLEHAIDQDPATVYEALDIVTLNQAAARLNVHPAALGRYANGGFRSFPEPIDQIGQSRVWLFRQIERWAAAEWEYGSRAAA